MQATGQKNRDCISNDCVEDATVRGSDGDKFGAVDCLTEQCSGQDREEHLKMPRMIAALTAATLLATAAYAQPDKDKGHGNGGGKPAAHAQSGNGNKNNGPKGNEANKPRKLDAHSVSQIQSGKPAKAKFDKGHEKARDSRVERQNGNALHENDRQIGKRGNDNQFGFALRRALHRPIDGCPPGLAKKFNGCMPPGLAKKGYKNEQRRFHQADWWGLASLDNGRYSYNDGYLLRLNDGGQINGYIPLLSGALAIGNRWPSYYKPAPLAPYYADYYGLGSVDGYRYADDVIYRVNPKTSNITSIVALLTGDQFGKGTKMPAGYDIYNVPYAYRDRYYDQPNAQYRYSDGYIYKVDPATKLIASVISLIV